MRNYLKLSVYCNVPLLSDGTELYSPFFGLIDFIITWTEKCSIKLMAPLANLNKKYKLSKFAKVETKDKFESIYGLPYYQGAKKALIKSPLSFLKLSFLFKDWIKGSDAIVITGPSHIASMILLCMYATRVEIPVFLFVRGDKLKTIDESFSGIFKKVAKYGTLVNYKIIPIFIKNKIIRGVIGVGDFTLQAKEFLKANKIAIYPMVSDILLKNPKNKCFNGPLTYGYVGRFDPEKKPLEIIKLFTMVRENNERLIMVGSGEMFNIMKAFIKQHNLLDTVSIYPPYSSKKELIDILDKIHVFIHLASTGSGRSVYEAMARKCVPIVSIGGIDNFLFNGQNCFLLKSIEDIKKIYLYLRNPSYMKNLSNNAILTSQKLTFKRMRDRMLNFIKFHI